ncbi:cytochrome-c peroxidase [Nitrogeniibacter aestuarii]|uniref:cytochrome-c peroxidase n=1 Tax=Nitrogeniibacter aestuarii TaxID=2815343 RepID=UPI001E30DAC4|nr:cytochrome c peroxidase [Nitrogeniibacter aestuarii]
MRHFGFTTLILAATVSAGAHAASAWQALPAQPPIPADNPQTPAKIELGKTLFHDPRLSSTGTVSCASCHSVMEGGDDHRPVSIGVHGQTGGRNAPTVWNAAYHSAQFWDGRAATLEAQAVGPVTNPVEMGMADLGAAVGRLKAIPGYAPLFAKAFGAGDSITVENLGKAIAAYERTLITPNSPYDRYVRGDKRALSPQQVRGMTAFAETGCGACHAGAAFNGPTLPMGQANLMRFPAFADNPYVARFKLDEDPGRFASTGKEEDKHMWRVPTLRNLAYTAPYFHNGAVKRLDDAVKVMAKTQLNVDLDPSTVADIVAFLDALNGEFPDQTMPRLPATPGDLVE